MFAYWPLRGLVAASFTVLLRSYQFKAVEDIRASYRSGKHAPLLVSPTGSGKTCIFSYIAQNAAAKGNRTFILCHRQEIIRQIETALDDFQTPHGVVAAHPRLAPNALHFNPRATRVAIPNC